MKPRVLVVEDNSANRELLCDWLEAAGLEAVAAEDLNQAFNVFRKQPPQAVLLDVQLGMEDGLSLAKWVRQHAEFPNIPVIAVTAHALVTDHDRVMEAGCNAWISKPVDFKLLSVELERCLGIPVNLHSRPEQVSHRPNANS